MTLDPELLCALVRHFWPWTASANGVGCEPDEEPGELALEWNEACILQLRSQPRS